MGAQLPQAAEAGDPLEARGAVERRLIFFFENMSGCGKDEHGF